MADKDPLDHDDNGKKGGAKPKMLAVFLDYDTWLPDATAADGSGYIRCAANSDEPQELPLDRAKQLLAEGKARRADPLPE